MSNDAMFKVWTDGLDVVVARDLLEVPNVLNRHYRVTGHSLRHRPWQEVAPASLLRLRCSASDIKTVTAAALSAGGGDRWVGRALSV